jgi:hypothetical protein
MSLKITFASVAICSASLSALAASTQQATPLDSSTSDSNSTYQTKNPAQNEASNWLKNRTSELAAPVAPKVEEAPKAVVAPVVPAAPVAPEVVAAPVAPGIKGYAPDANYSGACHVKANVNTKKYVLNETSSTSMVLSQDTTNVCFPSEKMARRYGFTK